jgi:hypothetical protein
MTILAQKVELDSTGAKAVWNSLGYQFLVQMMKVTTQTDIPSHFQGICHHANIFNSIQSLLPGRGAECEHTAAIVCVHTSEHVCTIRRTTTTTQNITFVQNFSTDIVNKKIC